MEPDPVARRLWPRVRPDGRDALDALARQLRAEYPGEPDAMLAGRLAARARLSAHGGHAHGGPPSVLTVERRLRAHDALGASAPGELHDGAPVRWAQTPVSRETVVGYWRAWLRARRAERLFVYAHVPFCRTKCGFCQFDSVVGHDEDAVERNLRATLAEARALAEALGPQRADAITIGGGTPSELSAAQLESLLGGIVGPLVARDDDVYFSVELNPDSTSEDKLAALARHGVNRVSFGVQSMHAPTLKAIARGYQTPTMVDSALAAARRVGGLKVAVDLIASLPAETRASFIAGVDRVLEQRPHQIVLYEYQPVTRRGRTMDAGALSLEEARGALLEITDAVGYRRVPHTGSSVIVERADARAFDVRYVQHARAPTSVLGLGPFAESHAFGIASYVAGADLGANAPYRAHTTDRSAELATYVGRRLGAAMEVDDDEVARYFGAPLAELTPETVGWLRETGALEVGERGHRASGPRHEASRAAWAFLDADRVITLRRRAAGGIALERALLALEEHAELIGRRAAPTLEGALGVEPIALEARAGRRVGLALRVSTEELDPQTSERWLGALIDADAIGELAAHGLIARLTAFVHADSAHVTVELAGAAPASLRALAKGLAVPDESWWARVTSLRVSDAGTALGWRLDPTTSRLWRAARTGLPEPLREALETSSIRFERSSEGEDALHFEGLEDSRLRPALPAPLRFARGQIRALRVPLRGARPLLESATLELTLRRGRALATVVD